MSSPSGTTARPRPSAASGCISGTAASTRSQCKVAFNDRNEEHHYRNGYVDNASSDSEQTTCSTSTDVSSSPERGHRRSYKRQSGHDSYHRHRRYSPERHRRSDHRTRRHRHAHKGMYGHTLQADKLHSTGFQTSTKRTLISSGTTSSSSYGVAGPATAASSSAPGALPWPPVPALHPHPTLHPQHSVLITGETSADATKNHLKKLTPASTCSYGGGLHGRPASQAQLPRQALLVSLPPFALP